MSNKVRSNNERAVQKLVSTVLNEKRALLHGLIYVTKTTFIDAHNALE